MRAPTQILVSGCRGEGRGVAYVFLWVCEDDFDTLAFRGIDAWWDRIFAEAFSATGSGFEVVLQVFCRVFDQEVR